MPEYQDFRRGEHIAQAGRVYELVYTSGFGLPFIAPDKETFAFVLGGRPEVAVRDITVDPFDSEVHAFVHVNETIPFDTAFSIEIAVVPEDSIFRFTSAIPNVLGASGIAELDRWRVAGGTPDTFEQSERKESEIVEGLDAPNLRNFLADLSTFGRRSGTTIILLSVVLLILLIRE